MPVRTAAKGMLTGLVMLALAIVAFGAVVLIGWRIGWWFKTENVQRNDKVYDQSYGRQNALKEQMSKNIALTFQVTVQIQQAGGDQALAESLTAQRKAIVGQVCGDAAKINPTDPLNGDQAKFVEDNCLAGSVDPSSVYAK